MYLEEPVLLCGNHIWALYIPNLLTENMPQDKSTYHPHGFARPTVLKACRYPVPVLFENFETSGAFFKYKNIVQFISKVFSE